MLDKEEKIVYINPSYNGIAIFDKEDHSHDCRYFATWFDEEAFVQLEAWANAGQSSKIQSYVRDFPDWDGNSDDIVNFSQFRDLIDFANWKKI